MGLLSGAKEGNNDTITRPENKLLDTLFRNLLTTGILFLLLNIIAVKLVGPLTIRPTKPLPHDLEKFVDGAGEKGIVLLSFGTLGDHVLHKTQVDMLAGTLERLEQRVIWRAKGNCLSF